MVKTCSNGGFLLLLGPYNNIQLLSDNEVIELRLLVLTLLHQEMSVNIRNTKHQILVKI